ncbi:MAG: beta strand repeat-containing protein, partial [Betaproteobacteria bacterium]
TGSVTVAANALSIAKVDASTQINGSPKDTVSLSRWSGSLAFTESETTAHATVADGASIAAGGDIGVLANGVSTNEAGSKVVIFLDGKADASLSIGIANSDVVAQVDGSLIADATAHPSSFASVDGDANTIALGVGNAGYAQGEAVVYRENGGAQIGGLEGGQTYYVVSTDDPSTIKLAEKRADALQGKAIDLKLPAGVDVSNNSLERSQHGIAVAAELESGDTSTAESGIGDTNTSLGKKVAGIVLAKPVRALTDSLVRFPKIQNFISDRFAALRFSGPVKFTDQSDTSYNGALAVTYANHHVSATVGNTASLKSRADILVSAHQTAEPHLSAQSSIDAEEGANPSKKAATSIAVGVGIIQNHVHATIQDQTEEQLSGQSLVHRAALDATGAIQVQAEFSTPLRLELGKDDVSGLGNIKTLVTEKLNVQESLFNSWTRSSANADESARAGSVDYLNFTNDTHARIGSGAQINQDVDYQTDAQSVSVEADAAVQLVNMSGVFDFDISPEKLASLILFHDSLGNLLGSVGGQKGIGGSALILQSDDRTVAEVGQGAAIRTGAQGRLDVKSDAKLLDLNFVASGGKGGGELGLAGSFAVVVGHRTTLAHIEGGATVTGGDVNVSSHDDVTIVNGAGGFIKGEAKGVGVSVAVNWLTRETAAYIGSDEGDPAATAGTSIDVAGSVTLDAQATGDVWGISLAGAFESNKPMAGDPVDPLDGVSLPILFGEMAPLEEPAKTGLGVAGSASSNWVTDHTRALINDTGTIAAHDIALTSKDDTDIFAISGAASIVNTQGSQTSSSLAGAFSINQLDIETHAIVVGAQLTTPSADATSRLTIDAEHGGYLFSFSAGGAGAPTENGKAGAGSVSVNRIIDSTQALLDGAQVTSAGDIGLSATDNAEIFAIAGGGSYGGKLGVGASIALNGIASDTQAAILGTDARATIGSEAAPVGTVDIEAHGDSTIQSWAISAGASQQTGAAVTLALNLIEDDPFTGTKNQTVASISNADVYASGDVALVSQDDAYIHSVAGALGVGGEKLGFGAALAWNQVSGTVAARIDDAQVITAGHVALTAESAGSSPTLGEKIRSAAVGAAGSGKTATGGALSINFIRDTIDAHVSGNSTLIAGGGVVLDASDASTSGAITGGIGFAGSNGVGAALATNDIFDSTRAYVDASTIETTGGDVSIEATSDATVRSLTLGGAGAGSFALGGSVSINIVKNGIDAHIEGSDVTAAGDTLVGATDRTSILAGAGGFAGAGSTAIGAAIASDDTADTTKAYISDSTVTATGSVEVEADSKVDISSATVSGGGAGSTNINGSIAVHVTHNTTMAYLGSGTVIDADGNVVVSASDDLSMLVGAGALGGAGSA